MREAADELAHAAYESNPDLIPASGAMVRVIVDHRITSCFSLAALEAVLAKYAN